MYKGQIRPFVVSKPTTDWVPACAGTTRFLALAECQTLALAGVLGQKFLERRASAGVWLFRLAVFLPATCKGNGHFLYMSREYVKVRRVFFALRRCEIGSRTKSGMTVKGLAVAALAALYLIQLCVAIR